jgi:pimeloyl-[acyl-carrier protein] methyl ester esterase
VRLFLPGWGATAELWRPFAAPDDLLGGDIEPGADVVAWSLGAMQALDAATRIGLRSLTLVSASPQFARGNGFTHGWRGEVLVRMRERLALDPDGTIDDFLPLMFAPGERLVEPPRERDLELLEAGLRFLERYSLRGREQAVRCPVRLLHGERDQLCWLSGVRELVRALPEADLDVLPGAGHALPLSHPSEVRAWLSR